MAKPDQPIGAPVKARAALNEEAPVVAGRWFAWTESVEPQPHPPRSRASVIAENTRTHTRFRVNPPGTFAQTGGIVGDRLTLQLVRRSQSDLAVVDLKTRRPSPLRGAINTPQWEWRPSASGRWLLFGRIDYSRNAYLIVLADTYTGVVRVLDRVAGHAAYAAPGQVNGNWAVWTSCPDNKCRVARYDIDRSSTAYVPNAHGDVDQFGASVTRSGVVYFGADRGWCEKVRLMKWDGAISTTVAPLPRGSAFQYSFVADAGRARDVYYDQVACRRDALSDIYRVRD